ncbi:hypothetical protein [Actinoplanes sp. URMC 104]|uniref:hypothetical protein n=1 Tax=Actinoplanes sp. URMC 104 TaxID=3423409 RepID=UPI003F1E38D0
MNIEDEKLLVLAKRLRDEAARAGRTDVVAKVDDAILLLAGERADENGSTSNVVLRILDGLGF